MKLPAFDYEKAQWDKYRRFYVEHKRGWNSVYLVQFETGEAICLPYNMKPADRCHHESLGIEFLMPHDPHMHKYAFTDRNGDPVKRAHIAVGQLLLLDHHTQRAVRINGGGSDWPSSVPDKLRTRGGAYFAGSLLPPVSGVPLRVGRPLSLSQGERRHLDELRAACKAWYEMADEDERWYVPAPPTRDGEPVAALRRIAVWEVKFPMRAHTLLDITRFADMPKDYRLRLALSGYRNKDTQFIDHEYLNFKEATAP